MDQETREKIEKYQGLDFCCPDRQRMFCPVHMWDVPAYLRKAYREYVEEFGEPPELLTNLLYSGRKK